MPGVVSYRDACTILTRKCEQYAQRELATVRDVRSRVDAYAYPTSNSGSVLSGDQIMANIKRRLNMFDVALESYQKMLIDSVLNALAPCIYGEEWERSKDDIMRRHGWKDHYRVCLGLAARQRGKTFTTSFIMTVCALEIPNFRGGVFSTSMRASYHSIRYGLMFLNVLYRGPRDFIIKKSNHECIVLSRVGCTDIRTFYAYPSNSKICLFSMLLPLPSNHFVFLIIEIPIPSSPFTKGMFSFLSLPSNLINPTSLIHPQHAPHMSGFPKRIPLIMWR